MNASENNDLRKIAMPNISKILNKDADQTENELSQVQAIHKSFICLMDESDMPVGNTILHYLYIMTKRYKIYSIDWNIYNNLEGTFLKRKQLNSIIEQSNGNGFEKDVDINDIQDNESIGESGNENIGNERKSGLRFGNRN